MGTDPGYWIHGWQPDGQLSNAKSLKRLPSDSGLQKIGVDYPSLCPNNISMVGALPICGFSELPNSSKGGQAKLQSHGWFCSMLRFREGLTSMPDMILKEEFLPKRNLVVTVPAADDDNCGTSNLGFGCEAKQFLVFDQTGDKTTLIYSSGIGTPVHFLASQSPKPTVFSKLSGKDMGMRETAHYDSELNSTDEKCRSNDRSELHEDTEEINALLYSDDEDDCPEDDEETSTGHSPSTMTAYDKQEWLDEGVEEVASSAVPAKRMRPSYGDYGKLPSLMDTACSAKPTKSFEDEDDAESSCGDGKTMRFGDIGSLSSNKRMRMERIHETVNILQSIIPGGVGKDAIMVLDEAIHYLKTLKVKARSVGLSTF
ncbi:hypothetical protein Nepgr_002058 [Nepenthes gracilis]|uniref:BHLH domain-containing protein n=1 Tax=Nepenthes gracilis TaxID=150966 RepID=A0AAD3P965_NEPGR|nr:hypothetical protein Nepgr_002058 [Nepenthes gracilis]